NEEPATRKATARGDCMTKTLSIISICQIVAIFIFIIVCLINLSLVGDKYCSLWSSLLSGSLGYLLPFPKLRSRHDSLLSPPAIKLQRRAVPGQHPNIIRDEIAGFNIVDGGMGSGTDGNKPSSVMETSS